MESLTHIFSSRMVTIKHRSGIQQVLNNSKSFYICLALPRTLGERLSCLILHRQTQVCLHLSSDQHKLSKCALYEDRLFPDSQGPSSPDSTMQRILKVQGPLHEVPRHPVTEPPDTLSKSNRHGMRDARASASMELPSQAAIPHAVSRTPVTIVRREQTAANTEKPRYSLWPSHWHQFLSEVRGISVYPRSLSLTRSILHGNPPGVG